MIVKITLRSQSSTYSKQDRLGSISGCQVQGIVDTRRKHTKVRSLLQSARTFDGEKFLAAVPEEIRDIVLRNEKLAAALYDLPYTIGAGRNLGAMSTTIKSTKAGVNTKIDLQISELSIPRIAR